MPAGVLKNGSAQSALADFLVDQFPKQIGNSHAALLGGLLKLFLGFDSHEGCHEFLVWVSLGCHSVLVLLDSGH